MKIYSFVLFWTS